MNIGVIGCDGFVGSALCRAISHTDHELIKINRENYTNFVDTTYDILINAATPSKRYWALHNPLKDFDATVGLTADIVYNWHYDTLIHISTISAKCQLDHPYGIHKYLAEQLVLNHHANNLVIRLGNLFGDGLQKGIVYDLIHDNPLFVSDESRYTFIDVDKAAEIICTKLGVVGIVDVSSRNSISLKKIIRELNLDRTFGERVENLPEPESGEGPDVNEVIGYINQALTKNITN